jgi:hypothetical protein
MDKAALESALSALDIWLIGFGVLVAIGVVGESVAGYLHWRKGNDLQAIQTGENLTLQRDIARLSRDADIAKGQIAEADARAAEANRKAVEAAVALEKFRTPRSLSPEQQASIIKKMRSFAGKSFDIAINNAGPEPLILAEIIEAVLKSAGWTQLNWGNDPGDTFFARSQLPNLGISFGYGIVIATEESKSSELLSAAQALASALTAEGVAATAQPPVNRNNNVNAIHIMVGIKR